MQRFLFRFLNRLFLFMALSKRFHATWISCYILYLFFLWILLLQFIFKNLCKRYVCIRSFLSERYLLLGKKFEPRLKSWARKLSPSPKSRAWARARVLKFSGPSPKVKARYPTNTGDTSSVSSDIAKAVTGGSRDLKRMNHAQRRRLSRIWEIFFE